jgi:RNA polymerase sigma-70 factor, ECF subfamily
MADEAVTRKASLRFDDVFRDHAARVHRMVASLLGPGASDADVQDLTQEVFFTVHRSLDRFRGESKVETWLYGIASNTVLMFLRSWRRHRRLVNALEAEPIYSKRADGEQATLQKDEVVRVWRCLMKIAPEKRVVFVLYEVEGFSGKEIADTLGINEATVRTRLFHARRELIARCEKLEKKERT